MHEINVDAPQPQYTPYKKSAAVVYGKGKAGKPMKEVNKYGGYKEKRSRSICVTIATGSSSRKERRTRSESS